MKELTIEEKAKCYDEAIKVAENIHRFSSDLAEIKRIEQIFPELKESENIRIIKAIKYGLDHVFTNNTTVFEVTKEQCLAWLEKQGQKETDPRYENLEELLAADDIYQMAMNDAMVEEAKKKAIEALSKLEISKLLGLEKQGEQKSKKVSLWKHWKDGIAGNGEGKPIYLIKDGYTYSISSCLGFECDYIELSELDKLLSEKQCEQKPYGQREECLDCQVNYAGECKGSCAMKRGEQILANSAKTCKDEQKPAWSEEDERIILAISQLLKDCESENGWNCVLSNDREVFFADIENYLQSFKNRTVPLPKQEWSEEEIEKAAQEWDSKANFNPFYMTMDGDKPTDVKQDITTHKESFKAGINWILKSLKLQSHWKPSEEQMSALSKAIAFVFDSNSDVKHSLESLYNELKKL